MTTSAGPVPRRSTFLTALPSEIRNDICERLLVHRGPIKITRGQSERSARVLLDVCRQLKAEFSGLYYHANTFTCQCTDSDLDRDIDSTNSLITWLQRIGGRNRGMLREVQIRIVNKRIFTKDDLFPFLLDQNVRLAREVGWLPLNVLRVRLEDEWLSQTDLSEMILKAEKQEEVDALERTGSSLPKGPDLLIWKRDIYDPVIDKFSTPGKRQLSEFVCPATWQYYARKEAESTSDTDISEAPAAAEKEVEAGCLSGGLKVLVAKMRKGKVVVARFRWKRRRLST